MCMLFWFMVWTSPDSTKDGWDRITQLGAIVMVGCSHFTMSMPTLDEPRRSNPGLLRLGLLVFLILAVMCVHETANGIGVVDRWKQLKTVTEEIYDDAVTRAERAEEDLKKQKEKAQK